MKHLHDHRRTWPLIVLITFAASFGCGDSTSSPNEVTTEANLTQIEKALPPSTGDEGHDRMVQELHRLALEALEGNAYFDVSPIPKLESQLQSLPEHAPDAKRWRLNYSLGLNHLRLGNNELAIDSLEAACSLLDKIESELTPEKVRETRYDTALAYLRLAETQNCVEQKTCDSCIFPLRGGGVHVRREAAEQAVRHFVDYLERYPDDIRARWLLNLSAMALGDHPAGVPENLRLAMPSPPDANEAFPQFVDIAEELGLAAFDLSGGAILEDFDNDSDLDILTSTLDPAGPLHYYINEGKSGFREATAEAGLEGLTGGLNLVQADYDNDGFIDVLVLRGAWFGVHGRHPNSLLRNQGNGTFRDVTYAAGLAEESYPTQTGAFADYDNDGDLDLYVGSEATETHPHPSKLYSNDGDGTFTDVTEKAGVANLRFAKSVVWGDYDNDRYPDLYVSNLGSPNRLYRNLRDGTFEDVAVALNVERPIQSFPSWFFDYDNDGDLDLFVSSYWSNLRYFVASYMGAPHQAESARLYRNDGSGGFEDVSKQSGLKQNFQPMGSNFGDVDNDGYLDMYFGTGYPGYDGLMPNIMFRNLKGQGFEDVTVRGGFGHLQKGHGVSFADLDHDGDQDVFIQMGGAYPGDRFHNALFENPGFGHHWLRLSLTGTKSNRCAIGARVRVRVEEPHGTRDIHVTVGSGGSFGGSPLRVEIGLGTAEEIASLRVYWPTSDSVQVFEDLEVNQSYAVIEGGDAFEKWTCPRILFR